MARLVADIGGTNSRLAVFDEQTQQLGEPQNYRNRDFDSLEAVLASFIGGLPSPPAHACLAIAAPLDRGEIAMTNLPWRSSHASLVQQFGFEALQLVNDFQAVAYALPYLQPADLAVIHAGPGSNGKLAAVGPGTGLGGATFEAIDGHAHVTPCEPGHAGLAVATELEVDLLRLLMRQYDHVHVELLVSGPGLERIYLGLCKLHGQAPRDSDAAAVSSRALAAEENLATEALTVFCSLLGSACGDFLLNSGAFGGLYLAGGIVPRMLGFLQDSDFHQRLCNKGSMARQLDRVPVHAITGGQVGLLGAAWVPMA